MISSINAVVACTQIRHTKLRIENYVENTMSRYSIDDFKKKNERKCYLSSF